MADLAALGAIKACVFDAYGTVFNITAIEERFRPALGERTAPLIGLWRSKQLEYSWLRTIRGDYQDFWHVTGEALDHAFEVFAIDDPLLRSRMMDAFLVLPAYPSAQAALSGLRGRGLRRVLLSNGSPSMLVGAVGAAGLQGLFDAVLSVDSVQAFKPHPSVYKLPLDHLGLAAGDIGFISGNPWDLAAAGRAGYRTIWVNRSGAPFDRLPEPPAAMIGDLDALPELLAPAVAATDGAG